MKPQPRLRPELGLSALAAGPHLDPEDLRLLLRTLARKYARAHRRKKFLEPRAHEVDAPETPDTIHPRPVSR